MNTIFYVRRQDGTVFAQCESESEANLAAATLFNAEGEHGFVSREEEDDGCPG
jgi:hypothetical protein